MKRIITPILLILSSCFLDNNLFSQGQALYGSEGSDGVILIETKRGSEDFFHFPSTALQCYAHRIRKLVQVLNLKEEVVFNKFNTFITHDLTNS